MLAHALLTELFNVFPFCFMLKVCVGAMLSDYITLFLKAHILLLRKIMGVWCLNPMAFLMDPTI